MKNCEPKCKPKALITAALVKEKRLLRSPCHQASKGFRGLLLAGVGVKGIDSLRECTPHREKGEQQKQSREHKKLNSLQKKKRKMEEDEISTMPDGILGT